ncbi:MAG: phytanoyl-CoA dioxygenase family protein, partial [Boseongicola sp. SB0670_bin_30]|nr:phytanoyl-CoA dioxygenase family protein [Boseongicola sp. SB0670_bin_30]
MTIKLEDGRLPEEDIAQYWRDGFLFPVPVFSAEETVAARTSLEDMERDWLDDGVTLEIYTYKRVNAHVVM